MNREIKFRGFGVRSKEWVEGDLIHGVGSKEGKMYILPRVSNLAYVKCCDPLDGVEVVPESVVFVGDIFDATELWNNAPSELSVVECNGYWKALRDLEKQNV